MNWSMFQREMQGYEKQPVGEIPFNELMASYNLNQELKKQAEGQPHSIDEKWGTWLKARMQRERERYIQQGKPVPSNLERFLEG